MSEYFVPMVVCDRCMPGIAPVVVDGVYDVEVSSGYCVGLPLDAVLSMGWQDNEDFGHVCPACVQAIKDDQDAELGADHGAMQLGVFYEGQVGPEETTNKESE